MSDDRGAAHVSDPLLPTFAHDRLEVDLRPVLGASRIARQGSWTIHLSIAVLSTLWFIVSLAEGLPFLPVMLLLVFLWAAVVAVMEYVQRSVHLALTPGALVVTHRVRGRTLFERRVPLAEIRTIHGLDTHHQGIPRWGLRLVLSSGEDLFYDAPGAPIVSLEWLAAEIRAVAEHAAERAAGEAPPELVDLLTPETRSYTTASSTRAGGAPTPGASRRRPRDRAARRRGGA